MSGTRTPSSESRTDTPFLDEHASSYHGFAAESTARESARADKVGPQPSGQAVDSAAFSPLDAPGILRIGYRYAGEDQARDAINRAKVRLARSRTARTFSLRLVGLLLVMLGLASCIDQEAPTPPTVIDAGAELDAAPPACGIGTVQRAYECKAICNDAASWCPGQLGADCFDECWRFSAGSYYCPER